MNKNGNSLKSTAIILIAIVTVITTFVVKAVKAGRTLELFISTPILLLEWYLTYNVLKHIDSMDLIGLILCYGIPFLIYSIYWIYLFSHPKITSSKADSNWADRDWWWTLNGWEFEEEVAKIFRLNGYQATVTKKTGDYGVDIIMSKDNFKYVVQCKHYKNPVGPEPIRALWGVKDDFIADKVIIVASSGLTDSASSFIENKKDFEFYDLEDIIRMGLRPC